jgi:hypothetical protein
MAGYAPYTETFLTGIRIFKPAGRKQFRPPQYRRKRVLHQVKKLWRLRSVILHEIAKNLAEMCAFFKVRSMSGIGECDQTPTAEMLHEPLRDSRSVELASRAMREGHRKTHLWHERAEILLCQ